MYDYDAEFTIQATRFYLFYLLDKKYNAKKQQYYRCYRCFKLTKTKK
jgi:hypothetical protein